MDTLSFIAALIHSLAWPLTAIVLGLVFEEPIGHLIRSARRMKGFGVEIERDFDALRQQAASIPAVPTPSGHDELAWLSGPVKALRDQAQAVAEISPVAAISLAWLNVEQQLRAVVVTYLPGEEQLAKAFSAKQIDQLHARGIIDNAVAAVLHHMRELRNRITHGHAVTADISLAETKGYVDVAASVIEYFGSLLKNGSARVNQHL